MRLVYGLHLIMAQIIEQGSEYGRIWNGDNSGDWELGHQKGAKTEQLGRAGQIWEILSVSLPFPEW